MNHVSRPDRAVQRAALSAPAGRRAGAAASTDSLAAVEADGSDLPLGWLGGGDGGAAVPEHLQERFAAAGADVSGVRLHTGDTSAEAAEGVSARAFAFGQDVHFGAGEYQPGTPDGDRLIAHELAHTVQQRGAAAAAPQFALDISQPDDAAEVEAEQFADAIVTGSSRAAALPTMRPRTVARQSIPAQAHALHGPQTPQTPPTPQAPQTPPRAGAADAATFTDQGFLAMFAECASSFRRVAAGRPISALFSPDEQRAVAGFLGDRRLPPVGTFATFFATVDESLRFTFSAELHMRDNNLSGRPARRRNGQVVETRATRANDCGDWLAASSPTPATSPTSRAHSGAASTWRARTACSATATAIGWKRRPAQTALARTAPSIARSSSAWRPAIG